MKAFVTVAALVACLAAPFVRAQNESKSFQMPRAETPTAPEQAQPTPLDTFEFNGFMKLDGKTSVSVYDTKDKKSYWLELEGPSIDGLRLQMFDPRSRKIIIARGGQIKELALKEAKIQPLKIAPAIAQPGNGPPNVVAGPTNNANVAPSESDEEVRERMRRVAEEIRRRRAERRQMIEQRQQSAGGK